MKSRVSRDYSDWLDKANFKAIFTVWIAITIIFGMVYFFLATDTAHLEYTVNHTQVTSIFDTIYFSFVSGTTTGFGDIVPIGGFKLIAIIQVVVGLLLLALVTSRLVSIKQNAILSELYNISFKERINRLRSSLLLFRQSIERIITAIEDKSFKENDLKNVNGYLSSFDYALAEIKSELDSNIINKYTKNIDYVNTEILFNSILSSFEKFVELLELLDKTKIVWKKEISIGLATKCLASNDKLFESLKNSGLKNETIHGLETRKRVIKDKLKNQMYD
ncbi:MAG: potassium channel family protein [archaeon]